MGLSLNEIKRYSRQLVLQDMGAREQGRLKSSKVAVTGAGGLG
jgi:adenylyltransferase/sulfurtransferase